eukprot:CAMPEP_0113820494 /NCGR_PEP_ID=MMETSP0328-20130328/1269_1 /TAXON_ID=39455 /ORGANISM="Alexandrium minutum" /LENGTH=150 /DNA_ID=CAMNT_0000788431 /DNA_START=19 /DNA_END=471 /DNA_ORIENTATION=- /assembly_acc=CAM_ASM_000350
MALPKLSMKRAMKTAISTKAMKAMKAKRVSKVAKGRLAKALVFKGSREKTVGGVKAEGLMKNKRGRIVSKRASANGRRRFQQVEDWIEAIMEARQVLHTKGFVAINGKTLQGKALYVKAKAIRAQKRGSVASASAGSTPRASAPPTTSSQ